MANRNSPKNHGSENPLFLYNALDGKERANLLHLALRQHVRYADFFFMLEHGAFHTSVEKSISFRIMLRAMLRLISPNIYSDE